MYYTAEYGSTRFATIVTQALRTRAESEVRDG